MLVLITYDVSTSDAEGQTRLRKVAKQCVNHGQRVQKSVFECSVDPAQFAILKAKLADIIDPSADSIRFYFLGNNWKRRIEQIGLDETYDPEGLLMV